MNIPAQPYIRVGDMSGNLALPIIVTGAQRRVRISLNWAGTGSPSGVFTYYGSDDRLALEDKQNGTNRARWDAMAIPTPDASVNTTVSGTGATIGGTTGVGALDVTFVNPPAFIYVAYVAGGGAANRTLNGNISGTP